ncbi:uncharacterized [Tachysurus ichikawai]
MSVEEALVDGKAGVPLFLPVAFVPLGGPFRHWPKIEVMREGRDGDVEKLGVEVRETGGWGASRGFRVTGVLQDL